MSGGDAVPIGEVRAPGVCFATHLATKMHLVKQRSLKSQTEWTEFTKAMKELALVEENYGKGLRRVAALVGKLSRRDAEFYGVADALEAVRSNLNHSGEMHAQLSASVASDVAQPVASARHEAAATAKQLAQRGATQHKHLKFAEERRKKTNAKAAHLAAEAAASKEALADLLELTATDQPAPSQPPAAPPTTKQRPETHGVNLVSRLSMALNLSAPATSSSGGGASSSSRGENNNTSSGAGTDDGATSSSGSSSNNNHNNNTVGHDEDYPERLEELREKAGKDAVAAAEARRQADVARDALAAESRSSVLEAQRVLTSFQQVEETGIAELRDSLRKLCVFVSSALSNRHYDLQSLARVIDDLEPEADVERFVRACLGEAETMNNVDDIVDASALFSCFAPPSLFFASPSKADDDEAYNPTLVKLAVLPPVAKYDENDGQSAVATAETVFDLVDLAARRDANFVQVTLVPESPPPPPKPRTPPPTRTAAVVPPREPPPPDDDDDDRGTEAAKEDDDDGGEVRHTKKNTPGTDETNNGLGAASSSEGTKNTTTEETKNEETKNATTSSSRGGENDPPPPNGGVGGGGVGVDDTSSSSRKTDQKAAKDDDGDEAKEDDDDDDVAAF
mmetsp:Transcript_33531/g.107118  ORF Transcript_33531/g.107118 Transcript_33531/m.107118 type:complete len:624 (+) Transcript_33531:112-1983(+)